MSYKGKSHNIGTIPMSLEVAESVIYSQEFFNIQRMYKLARQNGESALREAEQNLRHSIRINFNTNRTFENETIDHEEEMEDLFQNISPNDRNNIPKLLSRAYYSKPNSPTHSETQGFLPNSSTLHIRSRSLNTERNSPINTVTEPNITKPFDKYSSAIKDDIIELKNYPTFPLKSYPLRRTSNQSLSQLQQVWSTSNTNLIHLKTTDEIKRSEKSRLNQLRKQNSFPVQPKNMSLVYGLTNIPNHPGTADICSRSPSFSAPSNNLQRFTKQLTIQGSTINKPLSLNTTSINEDTGKYWTNPLRNVRENIPAGFETEGRLHYYVVGTTNDS